MPDEQRRQKRRAATMSRLVCQIMHDLDDLIDRHSGGLDEADAAAVRVFATDANQPLKRLNAKLLRIPDAQR